MEPFLSGTTACRWYVNNGDIPEIEKIYNRYKLCFMGADGTSELEFVNFDQKYQLLIGKPLYGLEKKYDRFETPPEDISKGFIVDTTELDPMDIEKPK
ncbi:hypothetical protein ZEAMMB73_Zm00001d027273 [Zea mays]|uniref:Uncharacterized protein n=1 Tax=Zea mays TaxID=4577 RepID=A0A1D6JJN8_MAIZE|nr:hypothetical protein ZEAMMB73_Zm00001d027273 [Zea mays]